MVGDKPYRSLLDLGTGTGRMLELLAPRAVRAAGIDQSAAMLALARSRIDQADLRNVHLRQGDIYAPPAERDGYDLVVIHQVLHFLDDPARALKEAARASRRAAGSSSITSTPMTRNSCGPTSPIAGSASRPPRSKVFSAEAGLVGVQARRVPPAAGESGKLTVVLWLAEDPRIISDGFHKADAEFA